MWRPIDAIADWLADRLGPENQLRLGILIVIGTLPLYAYGPFSGEPLGIYYMSAVALSLAGVAILVGAEVLLKQHEDSED